LTGKPTPQPFVDGDIYAMFNGEIYNYPFKRSDGENIIPLYKQHGPRFAQKLDGEFAIVVYDFAKKQVVFATDTFGTKPLWVNGTQCASYKSGVGGKRLGPNKIVVKDMDGNVVDRHITYQFEWDNQYKDNYDDWLESFEKAVDKRAKDGCFIGLSSGYDSGALSRALLDIGVDFKAYHVPGHEHELVMERRSEMLGDKYMEVSPVEYEGENIEYTIKYDGKIRDTTLYDDKAAAGLSGICKQADKEGRRIYISGQGADEVLADYGLWASQSELKGVFPDELRELYNFRRGCQESYLGKEEYV
jgi:asparagine synthetase B (glutamine-hydrolysing)